MVFTIVKRWILEKLWKTHLRFVWFSMQFWDRFGTLFRFKFRHLFASIVGCLFEWYFFDFYEQMRSRWFPKWHAKLWATGFWASRNAPQTFPRRQLDLASTLGSFLVPFSCRLVQCSAPLSFVSSICRWPHLNPTTELTKQIRKILANQ